MRAVFSLSLALFALAASAITNVALADENATQVAARRRLGELPITLYPKFVVQDSTLPAFVNSRARSDDAVVISWRDALKGSFRVSQLGIKSSQVWIYVSRDLDLAQQWWHNVQGISGIVYIPNAGTTVAGSMVDGVAETADALKCMLIVGIEARRVMELPNVAVLSRSAQVLTIYDNLRLRGNGTSYREYVVQMAAEARRVNPTIRIEVAIATARGENATKAVFDVLLACSELAAELEFIAT